ncbi:hypothetical protein [Paraclostridium dentum]
MLLPLGIVDIVFISDTLPFLFELETVTLLEKESHGVPFNCV